MTTNYAYPLDILDPDDRTVVLIDSASLHATSRELQVSIDYKKLRNFFVRETRLIKIYYFATLRIEEASSHCTMQPLIDWLDYNGYTTVTRTYKDYAGDSTRKRTKHVCVDMAVTAMALLDKVDHFILFAGDGDLVSLVEMLSSHGKKVSIFSSMRSNPPIVADELRRCSDAVVDIGNYVSEFASDKPLRSRREESATVEETDEEEAD